MRRTLPILLLLALTAGCAAAAGELGFPRVDSDDDDRVSDAEFAEFLDDVDAFDRYDDDDSGELSPEEYREAVDSSIEGDAYFRGFDRDRSGGLTRAEFSNGLFGIYDRDSDGWLVEAEFEEVVSVLSLEL